MSLSFDGQLVTEADHNGCTAGDRLRDLAWGGWCDKLGISAWGSRAILNSNGYVDFLPDRHTGIVDLHPDYKWGGWFHEELANWIEKGRDGLKPTSALRFLLSELGGIHLEDRGNGLSDRLWLRTGALCMVASPFSMGYLAVRAWVYECPACQPCPEYCDPEDLRYEVEDIHPDWPRSIRESGTLFIPEPDHPIRKKVNERPSVTVVRCPPNMEIVDRALAEAGVETLAEALDNDPNDCDCSADIKGVLCDECEKGENS